MPLHLLVKRALWRVHTDKIIVSCNARIVLFLTLLSYRRPFKVDTRPEIPGCNLFADTAEFCLRSRDSHLFRSVGHPLITSCKVASGIN